MAVLEPLRRSVGDLVDTLGEGWDWLRNRGAAALTRFRHARSEDSEPVFPGPGDRWGLLAADLAETDDDVVVRVETPGLEVKDFSVSVVGDDLVVRGEKRFQREDQHAHYHLFESAYGAFERRLRLPCKVDVDQSKARYRSGVLTIRLPRADKDERRRVRVEPG